MYSIIQLIVVHGFFIQFHKIRFVYNSKVTINLVILLYFCIPYIYIMIGYICFVGLYVLMMTLAFSGSPDSEDTIDNYNDYV
jgi:hypothetical protein